MEPKVRSSVFRRMEALFGLVPSFLKRLEDAGAILERVSPQGSRLQKKDAGSEGGVSAQGKVVCRHGPNEVRRPVGGDRGN